MASKEATIGNLTASPMTHRHDSGNAGTGGTPAAASVVGPVEGAYPLILHPSVSSMVTIYARHRLVFSLDVSPSVASLTASGTVLYDRFYGVLERCFLDLVKPIVFPSLNVEVRLRHTSQLLF